MLLPLDSYLFPPYVLEPINPRGWEPRHFARSARLNGFSVEVYSNARTAIDAVARESLPHGVESARYVSTSGSDYLSSCIQGLFRFGASNLTGNTDVVADIFVADHGFYPAHQDFKGASVFDDAWSFSESIAQDFLETGGRYYVTSAPKVWGLPFGGLLLGSPATRLPQSDLSSDIRDKILSLVMHNVTNDSERVEARNQNNILIGRYLENEGVIPFFGEGFRSNGPGAFVGRVLSNFNEVQFKAELQARNIRGTSFFGNQGIILPNHQQLTEPDLKLICLAASDALANSKT